MTSYSRMAALLAACCITVSCSPKRSLGGIDDGGAREVDAGSEAAMDGGGVVDAGASPEQDAETDAEAVEAGAPQVGDSASDAAATAPLDAGYEPDAGGQQDRRDAGGQGPTARTIALRSDSSNLTPFESTFLEPVDAADKLALAKSDYEATLGGVATRVAVGEGRLILIAPLGLSGPVELRVSLEEGTGVALLNIKSLPMVSSPTDEIMTYLDTQFADLTELRVAVTDLVQRGLADESLLSEVNMLTTQLQTQREQFLLLSARDQEIVAGGLVAATAGLADSESVLDRVYALLGSRGDEDFDLVQEASNDLIWCFLQLGENVRFVAFSGSLGALAFLGPPGLAIAAGIVIGLAYNRIGKYVAKIVSTLLNILDISFLPFEAALTRMQADWSFEANVPQAVAVDIGFRSFREVDDASNVPWVRDFVRAMKQFNARLTNLFPRLRGVNFSNKTKTEDPSSLSRLSVAVISQLPATPSFSCAFSGTPAAPMLTCSINRRSETIQFIYRVSYASAAQTVTTPAMTAELTHANCELFTNPNEVYSYRCVSATTGQEIRLESCSRKGPIADSYHLELSSGSTNYPRDTVWATYNPGSQYGTHNFGKTRYDDAMFLLENGVATLIPGGAAASVQYSLASRSGGSCSQTVRVTCSDGKGCASMDEGMYTPGAGCNIGGSCLSGCPLTTPTASVADVRAINALQRGDMWLMKNGYCGSDFSQIDLMF